MKYGTFSKLSFTLAVSLLFSGCGESGAYTSCVNRGVQYFKEIGSYPTLSSAPNTGRKAKDVAAERCKRNVNIPW